MVFSRAVAGNECTNRTDPDPVAVTLAYRFCSRHVLERMLCVVVIWDAPSSCRRDVDFVIFFGTQATYSVDG